MPREKVVKTKVLGGAIKIVSEPWDKEIELEKVKLQREVEFNNHQLEMKKLEVEELKIKTPDGKTVKELEAKVKSMEKQLALAKNQAIIAYDSANANNTTKIKDDLNIDPHHATIMSNCE